NQARPSVPQIAPSFQLQHPQAPQQQPMGGLGFPGGTAAGYPAVAARAIYSSTQGPGSQPFLTGTPQQPGLAMGMSAGGVMPVWPATPSGPMQPGAPQPGQAGTPLGGWSGY